METTASFWQRFQHPHNRRRIREPKESDLQGCSGRKGGSTHNGLPRFRFVEKGGDGKRQWLLFTEFQTKRPDYCSINDEFVNKSANLENFCFRELI